MSALFHDRLTLWRAPLCALPAGALGSSLVGQSGPGRCSWNGGPGHRLLPDQSGQEGGLARLAPGCLEGLGHAVQRQMYELGARGAGLAHWLAFNSLQ